MSGSDGPVATVAGLHGVIGAYQPGISSADGPVVTGAGWV